MLKKILLPLLIFFLSLYGFSQTKEIDSLKAELLKEKLQDTSKVRLYYSLAREYNSFNKDSFSIYTNKALDLSLKNNGFLLADIYNCKGIEYLQNSKKDSARIFLKKALVVLDEVDDKVTRASVYQNFSNSYEGTNEFKEKIDYTIKSMNLLDDIPYKQCIPIYNLGVIYAQSDMHAKALEYFEKAYTISEKGKNIHVESASLMAQGNTYLKLRKLEKAKVALEKALEIGKKTNSLSGYFEIYSQLGNLYDLMELSEQSEKAHLRAKVYAEALGVDLFIMKSIGSLANHYLMMKDYKKSSVLYKEFDVLYEKNPSMDLGVVVYKNWAETEVRLGNIDKSFELFEKYHFIKDSIYSKENRAILSETEAKYQSEKKDKEIAEQQFVLANKELALSESKAKTRIMSILIVSLLLAAILIWFSFYQRQKRKDQEILTLKREQQVQTLESLMEGEEKERMRIAKELHDGVNVDLSAIKYKLTSLLEKNNIVINEAVTMIDKSCEQVRAISHNLIPPSLKDFSLIETLEDFCTTTNNVHEPAITFNHIGESISITKKAEVNIFRIVQELVNNSIKHAEATEIAVQISHRDDTIQLTVEDNGVGFDRETITSNGIGLQNVQSRVDYLKANLDFNSTNKGTSYTIDINTNELV